MSAPAALLDRRLHVLEPLAVVDGGEQAGVAGQASASASTSRLKARAAASCLGAGGRRQLGAQPGDVVVDRDGGQRGRVDVEVDGRGEAARPRRRCDWVRRPAARTATNPRRGQRRQRRPVEQRAGAGRLGPRSVQRVAQPVLDERAGGGDDEQSAEQADLGAELGLPWRQQQRRRHADRATEGDPAPASGGRRARIGDHEEQEDQRLG